MTTDIQPLGCLHATFYAAVAFNENHVTLFHGHCISIDLLMLVCMKSLVLTEQEVFAVVSLVGLSQAFVTQHFETLAMHRKEYI